MSTNRLLVTGATGFVGKWTLRYWRAVHSEVELWATSDQSASLDTLSDRFVRLDLREENDVRDFVITCNPTHVIHLAGLVGEATLAEHLAVNVLGTENLYNALTELDGYEDKRVIQAGTAAMYGKIAQNDLPISEKNALHPLTAYAISKMVQDYFADMMWLSRGLPVIRARIFNLFGPEQPQHLVPATFIQQLISMTDGKSLQVGNMATRRDFVDVRDVIMAFDKLLKQGQPGEAYNIGSGKSVCIRDILDTLINMMQLKNVVIQQSSDRVRKNDVPDIFADITAISDAVNWQPKITLQESLDAMWKEDTSYMEKANHCNDS
jgi:GDP-4-dehydro-6-deoxy-D-mannose reductase